MNKRRRKRLAWQRLAAFLRREKEKEQGLSLDQKESPSNVEVHIHNYPIQAEFSKPANPADYDLESLKSRGRGDWR
jgi:hypothetical protein